MTFPAILFYILAAIVLYSAAYRYSEKPCPRRFASGVDASAREARCFGC